MLSPILDQIKLVLLSVRDICDVLPSKLMNPGTKVRVFSVEIYVGTPAEDAQQQPFFKLHMPADYEDRSASAMSFISDLFYGVQDCIKAASTPEGSKELTAVVCYEYESGAAKELLHVSSPIDLSEDMINSFAGFFTVAEKGWSEYKADTLFLSCSACNDETQISSDEAITSGDVVKIAESIMFNNENNFVDLLNDWLKARRLFIKLYSTPSKCVIGMASQNHPYSKNVELSQRFATSTWYLIPEMNAVESYLNSYYALMRETVRLSSLGEFALVDSDVEKMLLAISHPDCKLVSTQNGVRLDASIANPAILNSLFHNLRFLRSFSGIGSGYFDPVGVKSEERLMNYAFAWMALDKMEDNFRFSTIVGCLSGQLRNESEFLVAPREFAEQVEQTEQYAVNDTVYLFSGEAAQWFTGIKPIQPTRLYSKICNYFDTCDTDNNDSGKVLVIGANANFTDPVAELNKMLKDNGRNIIAESFSGCAHNRCSFCDSDGINAVLGKAVKNYDMIFLLDSRGLYENEQVSPYDEYRAFSGVYMSKGPVERLSADYEYDTINYFEPKKNLFMDTVNSVYAIYNGARNRRAAFAFKSKVNTGALKHIGELIQKTGRADIRTKQLFIYLAEAPSAKAIDCDLLSLTDKNILPVGKGTYETVRMMLFLADRREIHEPTKEFDDKNIINVQAWAVLAAIHSNVDEWFIDPIIKEFGIKELCTEKRDELVSSIQIIIMHTYLSLEYNYESGETFDLSYRFTWDTPEPAIDMQQKELKLVQQRVCAFMSEFLRLAYTNVEGWGDLFDDPLPRRYMHCVLRDILYITLSRYSLSYRSLLFSSLVENRSQLLPTSITPPAKDKDGNVNIKSIKLGNQGSFDFASQLYYKRILSLLNRPTYSRATDAYISHLATIAKPAKEKNGCSEKDDKAAAFRSVMNSIQIGCESLGCMGTYIYNNSLT